MRQHNLPTCLLGRLDAKVYVLPEDVTAIASLPRKPEVGEKMTIKPCFSLCSWLLAEYHHTWSLGAQRSNAASQLTLLDLTLQSQMGLCTAKANGCPGAYRPALKARALPRSVHLVQ